MRRADDGYDRHLTKPIDGPMLLKVIGENVLSK